MSITVRQAPTDRVLELGGGSQPRVLPKCMGGQDLNVDVRPCYTPDGKQTVDFTADFNEPLPIQDGEWDAVFSHFVLEHISWRKARQFIREMLRVIKPGGKCVCVTANTAAQFNFLEEHSEGWNGQPSFESFSQVIFGDNDYPENTHRNYLTPALAAQLFTQAGFERVTVAPYGEAKTDMVIEAWRPVGVAGTPTVPAPTAKKEDRPDPFGFGEIGDSEPQSPPDAIVVSPPEHAGKLAKLSHPLVELESRDPRSGDTSASTVGGQQPMSREEMYDRHYFGGGGKVGGYAREGYWDYPVHEVTAQHVLDRRPESVLELGCARGYILKRLQDTGIHCQGMEVSKHCYLTRVADLVELHDLCVTPWPISEQGHLKAHGWDKLDLCLSVATLEHVPEEHLPAVIKEMARTCKRGLHGIDFGHNDDGFDKTHCTLKPRDWWVKLFNKHAPGWPVEVVDKEELERGPFPPGVQRGDGKVKLNIGSYTTMYHHGWVNIDVHDLGAWAQGYNYNYLRHDVRQGLPFGTGQVDLIMCCHMLEHLTYSEGLEFLRECRRVLKEDGGVMRILVPDAWLLAGALYGGSAGGKAELAEFDAINEGCESSPTALGKLWSLLHAGHASAYDFETLKHALNESGFVARLSGHRISNFEGGKQILRETIDMLPCLTLYAEAIPTTPTS